MPHTNWSSLLPLFEQNTTQLLPHCTLFINSSTPSSRSSPCHDAIHVNYKMWNSNIKGKRKTFSKQLVWVCLCVCVLMITPHSDDKKNKYERNIRFNQNNSSTFNIFFLCFIFWNHIHMSFKEFAIRKQEQSIISIMPSWALCQWECKKKWKHVKRSDDDKESVYKRDVRTAAGFKISPSLRCHFRHDDRTKLGYVENETDEGLIFYVCPAVTRPSRNVSEHTSPSHVSSETYIRFLV